MKKAKLFLNLFNLFKKKENNTGKNEPGTLKQDDTHLEELEEQKMSAGSSAFIGSGGTGAHKVLKGFYVSEKSSLSNSSGQYVFKVFKDTNKSAVKKEVSKLFSVKIKSIKILNMPEKRRDFGKHPGTRSGFKKAVIVLEKGYVIGQAKP